MPSEVAQNCWLAEIPAYVTCTYCSISALISAKITMICDNIIYKRGTVSVRHTLRGTVSVRHIMWGLESSVTHTFLTPPANPVQFFGLKMHSKCVL